MKCGLRLGQQFGYVRSLLLSGVLVAVLFESLRDDLLLALRDLLGVVASTAASTTTSAATALGLRKLALERVGLDKHHIGVGFGAGGIGVLRGGVDADQIAGNELETFERKRCRAVSFLCAFFRKHIHRNLGAAVDRIMQRNASGRLSYSSVWPGLCKGDLFSLGLRRGNHRGPGRHQSHLRQGWLCGPR